MPKNGKILLFLYDFFSRFHKIKTRKHIKNLRHGSFHMNVFYTVVKFCLWETNIKGDMLVKKIKVKKSIFQFLTPSFMNSLAIFIGPDILFFKLSNDM